MEPNILCWKKDFFTKWFNQWFNQLTHPIISLWTKFLPVNLLLKKQTLPISVHLHFTVLRYIHSSGEEISMATPYSSSQTYIDEFNPVDYYKTYYDPKEGILTGQWIDFVLRKFHETFTTGGVKGALLTDFGAGPAIFQLLSACECFDNIITSDFLEQNRIQLQKWLRNDPDALDWSHIVKKVCELEGKSDSESCKKKEEKVRRKVSKVMYCDALKENPFDPVKMPQADCLTSCLCLEAPCKDVNSFTTVLKNFKNLIKPGGHIVILSVLNSAYYYVGKKKFSCLAITKEEVETAFKEAGYEIVKLEVIPFTDKPEEDICNHDSYYFVHARKPCSESK